MNIKKLSYIVKKAKKTYTQTPERYNQFLYNNYQINSLNNIIGNKNNNNKTNNSNNDNFQNISSNNSSNNLEKFEEQSSTQIEQNRLQSQISNYPQQNMNNSYFPQQSNNYPQQNINQPYYPQVPQINIIGNSQQSPMTPINIIAKNYINPDTFDNDEYFKNEEISNSTNLAKIPDNLLKNTKTDWEPINYRGVDEKYQLYHLSNVEIKFDEVEQKIIYKIIEPELTDDEKEILFELKKGFIYVFEKYSPEFIDISQKELVIRGSKKLCSKYNIKLSDEQFEKITYYLARDFLGLELLEPIMHDKYIEDVSCDGLGTPIFVNHLKYGPLEVNRKYLDIDKLNSFIIKLAQKSNQEISLSKPILQGALTDGSRVEAIYGKEVSGKGSSFTIRKFRSEPFTPIHLIDTGTMPPFLLAYLWLAVENKQSLLISGGTATGKTTILNALSLFAPPTSKIVSIEDTPEINLPHEHWLPMIAREGQEKSTVTMFDLLKASLRERPDYIIVGEIRGAEAAILFQGMATGHAGLGTVHAEKFEDLVNRMTIEPINLPKQLLTELNIVIFMKQIKVRDNIVRRAFSIIEVIDYNSRSDKFTTNEFVRFDPVNDLFNFKEKSAVISHLITLRGGKEDSLWKEIEKRRRILDYMHKNKIMEFKQVSEIIKYYYKDPIGIFDYIDKYKQDLK